MSKKMVLISCILAAMVVACTPGLPDEVANAPASDGDGDGFTIASGDCDDTRADVHPGNDVTPAADEVCDGADNDCNDKTDEDPAFYIAWYPDEDGDTYGDRLTIIPTEVKYACARPAGYARTADDCIDDNPDINPGAVEICGDDVNQDCDPSNEDIGSTWYLDEDGDTFGNGVDLRISCQQPDDYARQSGDCDDTEFGINPGAAEICDDGIDQDCVDGDEVCACPDADGDGVTTCDGDCLDDNPGINPGVTEICGDGIDQDCVDGDEACNCIDPDQDNDGHDMTGCGGDDCDDADPDRFPGRSEDCDGKDNACTGSVLTGELDMDADGFMACEGDCDDDAPLIFPGAPPEDTYELCTDNVDNDCVAGMDQDDLACGDFVDNDGDGYCEAATCINGSLPGDCRDDLVAVYPAAHELGIGEDVKCTDGIDNDCDGAVDLGDPLDPLDPADWDCMDADGDTIPNGVDAIILLDAETICMVADYVFNGQPWSRATGIRQGTNPGFDPPLDINVTDSNAQILLDGVLVNALCFSFSSVGTSSTRIYRDVSITSVDGISAVDPNDCNDWVATDLETYCNEYDPQETFCHQHLGTSVCSGGQPVGWMVGARKDANGNLISVR